MSVPYLNKRRTLTASSFCSSQIFCLLNSIDVSPRGPSSFHLDDWIHLQLRFLIRFIIQQAETIFIETDREVVLLFLLAINLLLSNCCYCVHPFGEMTFLWKVNCLFRYVVYLNIFHWTLQKKRRIQIEEREFCNSTNNWNMKKPHQSLVGAYPTNFDLLPVND